MSSPRASRNLSTLTLDRPASPPGWARRLRRAARAATQRYCERLVRRALLIDPAVDDQLTVDVHFCDVR